MSVVKASSYFGLKPSPLKSNFRNYFVSKIKPGLPVLIHPHFRFIQNDEIFIILTFYIAT